MLVFIRHSGGVACRALVKSNRKQRRRTNDDSYIYILCIYVYMYIRRPLFRGATRLRGIALQASSLLCFPGSCFQLVCLSGDGLRSASWCCLLLDPGDHGLSFNRPLFLSLGGSANWCCLLLGPGTKV